MTPFFLCQSIVTNEDAAQAYTEAYGFKVSVGDPEFRLLDHPEKPGRSEDFPTLEAALDYVKEVGGSLEFAA